ncbi:MAG: non-canonical purine NTP pyrophosphatase [bacterium]|nr:non-canonical purine NTP pyrophosphatase [bacterium]
MKEIVVGTTNEAKVKQIQGALANLDIQVSGVDRTKENLPEVEENGKTALENARKKALAYAKALGRTVLSMDNALYFDTLPAEDQPGLHVRRINKENPRPSDEELIEYYSSLIEKMGGETKGYWEFGICVATLDGQTRETTIISPRIFKSNPGAKVNPSYPLESLQIDPESGKFIGEMSEEEQALFWQKVIGKPLADFVTSVEF